MTSKPILFSGPMVLAILEGRKTQTRRVLKSVGDMDRVFQMDDGSWHVTDSKGGHMSPVTIPYPVGTELWVREAHALVGNVDPPWVLYRANGYEAECERLGFCNFPPEPEVKWRPSIHMPRWASRITLRVTAVKVERLQDISEADAKAEGAMYFESPKSTVSGTTRAPCTYYFDHNLDGRLYEATTARDAYEILWGHINGWKSWDANPWVAAYSFERVKP